MDRRDRWRLVAGSVVVVLVCLGITTTVAAAANAAPTRCAGVDSAYAFLYDMMDRYHETFDVYTDRDAGGNHYQLTCWFNGSTNMTFDTNWRDDPDPGTGCSCIKVVWNGEPGDDTWKWNGVGWVEATAPCTTTMICHSYDLTGAAALTFRARAEEDSLELEVGLGGGDSCSATISEVVTLRTSWDEYEIEIGPTDDLSNIYWGFVFAFNDEMDPDPDGCTFYLDDIQYELARPDSLRFILSYLTDCSPGDSTWAVNQAYTYDNALAMLAFLARGTDEDLRRARIIGDAFAFAQENDRHYTNGRLRNAYSSGDVRDQITGKARLPGWWGVNDEGDTTWMEDAYQMGALTGEMAWVTLAWLTHDQLTGERRYIDHATSLAQWIDDACYDPSGIAGYAGGYIDSMPDFPREEWKSTEHNIDVYVAFTRLAQLTDDGSWHDRARLALDFVEAMWDSATGHLWTGTVDSSTVNEFSPLDPQTFSLLGSLALAPYSSAISWAEENCAVECMGYEGFHYSTICDGIWWEGTAQMCCAFLANMEYAKADVYLNELRQWQVSAPSGHGRGIVACCPDSIWTGIWKDWGMWHYYDRLHVGATAWYLFAELDFNPFWSGPTGVEDLPAYPPGVAIAELGGARPNPTGSEARISYSLSAPSHVTLAVYDVAGRRVATLVDCVRPAGEHVAAWSGTDLDGNRLAAGVYFCRLASEEGMQTCKTVILR